jgi:uncharacterized protein (TIGR00290 family)
MTHRRKVVLSWSSGKDSAWALHVLRRRPELEVVSLLTTVNEAFDRVAMHAVRSGLLRAQGAAMDLPVVAVPIPFMCSDREYARAMGAVVAAFARDGVTAIAFGDLFLDDVRRYREDRLRGTGIEPLFPLWGLDTHALAREMIAAGMRARVTCVDPRQIDASFAGRAFDNAFIDELPATADPCGERGEFHSFVHDGPMFRHPVPITTGEIVERDGFVFADLLPAPEPRDASR